MAVPEQTPYIEHTGNGVTTSFALKFQCESKDHLIVLIDDIEPPIATWSLIGGDVVFTTAPAAGKKITLQRNTPFSRNTDYQSYNNSFRPPTVNKDFDWIWLKLQELGVADWILGARIDALKNYVDDRDDELRAYLMEEIRKQGVALDQLDEYYNYLMQRLAQIAVDKGWDASFVVDGDKNQKQINDDLLGEDGSKFINLKLSNVANAVKKSLYETVIDQVINVKWFGAKGDWNATTQTGTDDTVAIQNAINYYATLGSRRVGGVGAIKFPAGNYRYSSLTFPSSIGFGLSIIGDGQKSVNLWADHNDPNPAFISQIEFVRFHEVSLFGALADNISHTSINKLGFKGQLSNNGTDIDVEFSNCGIFCWNEFANIYGRGFVADGCVIGLVQTFLNVVCSEDTVFNAGNVSNTIKTGMRHYTMRGNRFDAVGTVLKVTGTGAQKDYINDVMIVGNDMLFVDKLIQANDATTRRSLVAMNNAMKSFATGVIYGKSFESVGVVGNNFAQSYDSDTIPTTAANTIEFILLSTGPSHFVSVSGNDVKYIKSAPVNVGAGSTNIRYCDNNHPQAWESIYGTSPTKYVVYSSANIENLIINRNMFSSTSATGAFNLFNGAVQTSKNTRVGSNLAPWRWADSRITYTPKLLVNGTASATASTASHGRYYLDDTYVHVEVMLSINPVESSGELAISLPSVAAVAENSAISTGYAGNGVIARYVGFTAAAGTAMSPVLVNPSNQQAELWKISNMTQARITAADRSGAITLYATFKYRY